MLRNDCSGGRLLSLRRRRSRLPWVYLVYKEGLRGKGQGAKDAPNTRSLTPYPSSLIPDGNAAESSTLRAAEKLVRRTPRASRDRCRPGSSARSAAPRRLVRASRRQGRVPAVD